MRNYARLALIAAAVVLMGGMTVSCGKRPDTDENTERESTLATETPTESEIPSQSTDTDGNDETNPTPRPPETETTSGPQEPVWTPPEEKILGEANVALGCPVITNDCLDYTNQLLTDGDGKTEYRSSTSHDPTVPLEILVDLTREYDLTGLRILNRLSASERPLKKFKVALSLDDITYTEVADADHVRAIKGGYEMRFTGKARYVRVTSVGKAPRSVILSEMEILSDVSNHDNIFPAKRALVMQKGAFEDMTVTYRLSGQGDIYYVSTDPSVVSVDRETGHIEALKAGQAVVYAADRENATAIPVTVQEARPGFQISTFFLANHGDNSPKVFDMLVEAGIQHLEAVRCFDRYGNSTADYLRVRANDYGLTITVDDEYAANQWRDLSDEEIMEIAASYKNLPGYVGLNILDEPSNANSFARVYLAMLKGDPFAFPHLNLLPAVMPDFHGYVSDWCATVGEGKLKCLSYDNYPFGVAANSFNPSVYDSMNELRKTGLTYRVNTGYYLHGMGIENAYRVPNAHELMYHAAVGVAYGMKDYKWFVWYTPPYYGSGEHFITGILGPDGEKSEMFEGVKAADAMLSNLSPYLGNTDAVELYHNQRSASERIPSEFVVTFTSRMPAILSLLVDRTTGQQYLVIVNSSMNRERTATLNVNDPSVTEFLDITSGEGVKMPVKDGKLSFRMEAGGICVLALPEGYDARTTGKEMNDGTKKSLLDGLGATVSSSEGTRHFTYMLNDGNRFATSFKTCGGADSEEWIRFDLRENRTFNRVDLYPAGDHHMVGLSFPHAVSISVSDDGETYRKIASKSGLDPLSGQSFTFEPVSARYICLTLDEAPVFAGDGVSEIGEIEVYMDHGQIPEMEQMTIEPLKPAENGNLIQGLRLYVSSSYEEYGWTQDHLNDGLKEAFVGTQQGWCSQIGSTTPDITEWVLIPLGRPTTVSKMVVYPTYPEELFAIDYHVEVSLNGTDFETVASVKGDNTVHPEPRVLEFEPVEAAYVRFVATKMGMKSSVGYKVQIVEMELYGPES